MPARARPQQQVVVGCVWVLEDGGGDVDVDLLLLGCLALFFFSQACLEAVEAVALAGWDAAAAARWLDLMCLDLEFGWVQLMSVDRVSAAFGLPVGEGADCVQASVEGGVVVQVEGVDLAVEELVPVEGVGPPRHSTIVAEMLRLGEVGEYSFLPF